MPSRCKNTIKNSKITEKKRKCYLEEELMTETKKMTSGYSDE